MADSTFFIDEDVYGAVAIALRGAGFDVVSTPEAARLGESAESQLLWVTNVARAIVTFTVAHFAQLHTAWLASGRHHCGIIVSSQRPIGGTIRRLTNLATTSDVATMRDHIEFLSNW